MDIVCVVTAGWYVAAGGNLRVPIIEQVKILDGPIAVQKC
jgi:hypothetical protein